MRHATSSLSLIALLVMAGCGDDDVPPAGDAGELVDAAASDGAVTVDAGGALDAARPDGAVADDAGSSLDGSAPSDAGPGADGGGVTADAGPPVTCAAGTAIPDRIAGVCDGRGRMACESWATTAAGRTATAQCVPPEGRCARADACDAAGVCTCGGAPECADDQMCVGAMGGAFRCACITPG